MAAERRQDHSSGFPTDWLRHWKEAMAEETESQKATLKRKASLQQKEARLANARVTAAEMPLKNSTPPAVLSRGQPLALGPVVLVGSPLP